MSLVVESLKVVKKQWKQCKIKWLRRGFKIVCGNDIFLVYKNDKTGSIKKQNEQDITTVFRNFSSNKQWQYFIKYKILLIYVFYNVYRHNRRRRSLTAPLPGWRRILHFTVRCLAPLPGRPSLLPARLTDRAAVPIDTVPVPAAVFARRGCSYPGSAGIQVTAYSTRENLLPVVFSSSPYWCEMRMIVWFFSPPFSLSYPRYAFVFFWLS